MHQKGMLMSIPKCIILQFHDTLSQWWYIRFWLSVSGHSSKNLHRGNFVNMLILNPKDSSVNDAIYSDTGTIVDGVFLRITVQIHSVKPFYLTINRYD